jgi:HSP20 family protein
MPIDAYRSGDTFVVELDMPGVDASSVDLTVQRNVLTIHAERRPSHSGDAETLAAERPHGVFSRQLFLGETLDSDRMQADYRDGVLTLRIPVAEQAKPRKVAISHGRGDSIDAGHHEQSELAGSGQK